MKKSIKSIFAGLLVVPVIVFGVTMLNPLTTSVGAATCEGGTTIADGASCTKPEDGTGRG